MSELLREMMLLDGYKVGVGLLKLLVLQRLPERTQAILAHVDSGSLEALANTADKIHEMPELQQTMATLAATQNTAPRRLTIFIL